MKNLYTLALVLLPLFSFSQDSIKLPVHVAKNIVKDLIAYEGVKKELSLCEDQVKLLEKKINAKDNIITAYTQKEETYKVQLQTEKEKVQLHKDAYEELKKEQKKLKRKLLFNRVGSGVVIGFLAYLLIMK